MAAVFSFIIYLFSFIILKKQGTCLLISIFLFFEESLRRRRRFHS
ncbi:hypothetical protein HOLDEFILI_01847 [Holdemania filiformis DSM 12042]|uniref:Uncharacterized protein n=1 Tax=Holdemania filiformis DSM 12042 TaxID=545696 RepID=B9Y7Q3_9FIRM|nr:hypothetical protein HOLDEFILI_01847 [Holdemania filiformis DSM 12042]